MQESREEMKLKDFFYELPEELIAQQPLENRAEAKLLVLNSRTGELEHHHFYEIPFYFTKDDVLVLNNTKVFKARIRGRKETGARIEILIVSYKDKECTGLIYPGRRIRDKTRLIFTDEILAEVKGRIMDRYFIEFNVPVEFVIEKLGNVPLPPYIKRRPDNRDEREYQTVYAEKIGSIAAPTAGLHFTIELLNALKDKGVKIVYITLHIGPGTFRPIKTEEVEKHSMEAEYVEITEDSAEAINSGRRVFGVGTSVTRALEFVAKKNQDSTKKICSFSGWDDLFIYPGFEFKVVDSLITNFHSPCSTPLLLVCAYAGKDLIFSAYKEAIKNKYRFLSYGDAMLIIK